MSTERSPRQDSLIAGALNQWTGTAALCAEQEARRILEETEPITESSDYWMLPESLWPADLPATANFKQSVSGARIFVHRAAEARVFVLFGVDDASMALADSLRAIMPELERLAEQSLHETAYLVDLVCRNVAELAKLEG